MRILTQFSSIFVIVSMETHGEAANEVVNETGGKKANNSSRSRNTEREREKQAQDEKSHRNMMNNNIIIELGYINQAPSSVSYLSLLQR